MVRSLVPTKLGRGALAASARFCRTHALRVLGLSLLNALAMLVVFRMEIQVFTTPPLWWLTPLLWAGLTLLAITARLAVFSSEVAFFQGALAHAGYTAAPRRMWPDSPAAEAIENLTGR